jgi:hypothetical protein
MRREPDVRQEFLERAGTLMRGFSAMDGVRIKTLIDLDSRWFDEAVAEIKKRRGTAPGIVFGDFRGKLDNKDTHLGGPSRLAELDLSETGMTDAGVIHLAKLPALRILVLHSTAISGLRLRALGELLNLRDLEIHSESVSDEEIAALWRALSSLRLNTNPSWSAHCTATGGDALTGWPDWGFPKRRSSTHVEQEAALRD